MASVTPNQAFRFGELPDVVSWTMQANLADDVAASLSARDLQRTAALKRPAVHLINYSGISLPVATPTVATYTSERYDFDGLANLGVSTSRITIPSSALAGVYWVQGRMGGPFGGTPWTSGEVTIRKNGGNVHRRKYWGDPQGWMTAEGLIWLGAAADYVDMVIYHEGGGASNVAITLAAHRVTAN